MSKPIGKHLQLYINYFEKTTLPKEGLCGCADINLIDSNILKEYFEPSDSELITLEFENHSRVYWGSGLEDGDWGLYEFTPLRQTIVLLMAAIAGEL